MVAGLLLSAWGVAYTGTRELAALRETCSPATEPAATITDTATATATTPAPGTASKRNLGRVHRTADSRCPVHAPGTGGTANAARLIDGPPFWCRELQTWLRGTSTSCWSFLILVRCGSLVATGLAGELVTEVTARSPPGSRRVHDRGHESLRPARTRRLAPPVAAARFAGRHVPLASSRH